MNLVMILAPGFEELEAVGTADVLARLGIDYLGDKIVLVDVHSAMLKTFSRNTGTHKLTHAVV